MQDSLQWIDSMLLSAATPEAALVSINARITHMEGQLSILKAVRQALSVMHEPTDGDDKPIVEVRIKETHNGKRKKPSHYGKAEITKQKLRDSIADAIMSGGPMESGNLKKITGASDAYFYEVMKGPWFVRESDGWHLTNEAFASLKDGTSGVEQSDTNEDNE